MISDEAILNITVGEFSSLSEKDREEIWERFTKLFEDNQKKGLNSDFFKDRYLYSKEQNKGNKNKYS